MSEELDELSDRLNGALSIAERAFAKVGPYFDVRVTLLEEGVTLRCSKNGELSIVSSFPEIPLRTASRRIRIAAAGALWKVQEERISADRVTLQRVQEAIAKTHAFVSQLLEGRLT